MDEAASLARARLQLGQRQLRATEQYRHEHRQERLTRLLQGSAQLTRYIYLVRVRVRGRARVGVGVGVRVR